MVLLSINLTQFRGLFHYQDIYRRSSFYVIREEWLIRILTLQDKLSVKVFDPGLLQDTGPN